MLYYTAKCDFIIQSDSRNRIIFCDFHLVYDDRPVVTILFPEGLNEKDLRCVHHFRGSRVWRVQLPLYPYGQWSEIFEKSRPHTRIHIRGRERRQKGQTLSQSLTFKSRYQGDPSRRR